MLADPLSHLFRRNLLQAFPHTLPVPVMQEHRHRGNQTGKAAFTLLTLELFERTEARLQVLRRQPCSLSR